MKTFPGFSPYNGLQSVQCPNDSFSASPRTLNDTRRWKGSYLVKRSVI